MMQVTLPVLPYTLMVECIWRNAITLRFKRKIYSIVEKIFCLIFDLKQFLARKHSQAGGLNAKIAPSDVNCLRWLLR